MNEETKEDLASIVTTDVNAPKLDIDTDKDDNNEEITRGPREDIYAAYDKKLEEVLDAPTGAEEEEVVEAKEETVAADITDAEDTAVEDTAVEGTAVEGQEDEAQPKTVTVKIYGEERQVQADEVEKAGGVDAYQIMTAGKERLAEANARREQLKREEEEFAKEKEAWNNKRNEEEVEEKNGKEKVRADKLADLYERHSAAQIDEDYAEAAEIQRQIDDERAAAYPPPDINQLIEDRLATHDREADRQAGTRWFDEEHKELAEDPRLRQMVDTNVAAMEKEYPQAPVSDIIRRVATDVSAWWSDKTAPAQQTSERVEKKRQLRQPRAASARQQPKVEQKPQTRAEAVAEMRLARGLED